MESALIDAIIDALGRLDPTSELQSIQVNYPLADHISFFYTDGRGKFVQRILCLSGGDAVEKTLLAEEAPLPTDERC
jgi:hypothetical protein